MLLRKIHLENFRQYKGKQNVTFAIDEEKNVTVILGQNTGGKTTFVQAFIWCLYNDITFSDKELMNSDILYELNNASSGLERNLEVTVYLIHKNREYIISRRIKYQKTVRRISKTPDLKIYESNPNGSFDAVKPSEYENIINSILPKELASYFFFWGERIERLSEEKNISSAVRDFLGLTAIDNARKHLKSAGSSFNRDLGSSGSKDTEKLILDIDNSVSQIEKDIPLLEKEIRSLEEDIEFFGRKMLEKEEELLKHRDSANAQQHLIKLQNDRSLTEKRIDDDYQVLMRRFNKGGLNYFSGFFKKAIDDVVAHIPDDDVGLLNQDEKSIMELINRGKCICGQELRKGSDAYNHVIGEIKKVSPYNINGKVETFITEMNIRINNSLGFHDDFVEDFKRYRRDENDLNQISSDILDTEKKIDKNVNTALIRKQKNDAENRWREKTFIKGQKIGELNSKINEKERLENKKADLVQNTQENMRIKNYIAYVKEIMNSIDNDYNEKESEIKTRLNELVNQYFKSMYHGEREASVDSNYNIQLVSKRDGRDVVTEESPGLQTVKNFAFIAALVEIAKERRNNDKEDPDSIIEPYPLVLDAPFSSADEIHVPNICKLISGVAEQTILVVMEKDWYYAKELMHNKVGAFYRLKKETETFSKIVPEGKQEV